jgi:hypothetical protein
MKKVLLATLSVLMLCSLLVIATLGLVMAGNPDYSMIERPCSEVATIDGKWTTEDEWTDVEIHDLSGNATGQFGYVVQDFSVMGLEWLVEIFTDNTTDEGDYWQISFDDGNSGGSAPDSGDFMIEIVGHTTLTVYQGTGSGWSEVAAADEITWADSIDSSPLNSTPHWILEVYESSKISDVIQIPNPPPTGMRIAAYDANTSTIAAWAPGSSAADPDSWGLIDGYDMNPIPEGIGFGVTVLLSCVAVAVSFYVLRKRPKNER